MSSSSSSTKVSPPTHKTSTISRTISIPDIHTKAATLPKIQRWGIKTKKTSSIVKKNLVTFKSPKKPDNDQITKKKSRVSTLVSKPIESNSSQDPKITKKTQVSHRPVFKIKKPKTSQPSLVVKKTLYSNMGNDEPCEIKNQFSSNDIINILGSTWLSLFFNLSDIVVDSPVKLHEIERKLITSIEPTPTNQSPERAEDNNINHERRPLPVQAFDAYFTHVNPYIPLFTKEQFFLLPRSNLLITAVIASGLRLLTPSAEVQNLLDLYISTLFSSLSELIKNLSLDNLQVMLVIQAGLAGSDIKYRPSYSIKYHFYNMAHGLGLHLPSPSSCSQNTKLERYFAYVAMINTDAMRSTFFKVPGYLSTSHCNIKPKFNPNFLSYDLDLFSAHISAHFSWNQSIELQKLSWCRHRVNSNNITPKQFLYSIRASIKALESTLSQCLSYLNQYLNFYTCDSVYRRINDLIRFMKSRHHSLKLQAVSLVVHELKEKTPMFAMTTAYDCILQQIHNSEELGCSLFYLERLNSIFQAALFIIRYHTTISAILTDKVTLDHLDTIVKRLIRIFQVCHHLPAVNLQVKFFLSSIEYASNVYLWPSPQNK